MPVTQSSKAGSNLMRPKLPQPTTKGFGTLPNKPKAKPRLENMALVPPPPPGTPAFPSDGRIPTPIPQWQPGPTNRGKLVAPPAPLSGGGMAGFQMPSDPRGIQSEYPETMDQFVERNWGSNVSHSDHMPAFAPPIQRMAGPSPEQFFQGANNQPAFFQSMQPIMDNRPMQPQFRQNRSQQSGPNWQTGEGLMPDPSQPVSPEILGSGYEYLRNNGGKDRFGQPLEDLEYYLNYMSPQQAAQALGVAEAMPAPGYQQPRQGQPMSAYGAPFGGAAGGGNLMAGPGQFAPMQNPAVQNQIQNYFMQNAGAASQMLADQQKSLGRQGRYQAVDDVMGHVAAPMMSGFFGLIGKQAAADKFSNMGAEMVGRSDKLNNMRANMMGDMQRGARNGFEMMQLSDPNNIKNQIALMNAATNAQRANYYGQQVNNQYAGQQTRFDIDRQKMQMEAQWKQADLNERVRRGDLDMAKAQQEWAMFQAKQRFDVAQLNQQMQIANQNTDTTRRGQDFSAYNNSLQAYDRGQANAAQQHFDKDGNPLPQYADWYGERYGRPQAPPPAAPPPDNNPFAQFFSGMFGGQPPQQQQQMGPGAPGSPPVGPATAAPMQGSSPAMTNALNHYRSLPPQQRQALRQQFMQKFGQDPGA